MKLFLLFTIVLIFAVYMRNNPVKLDALASKVGTFGITVFEAVGDLIEY